MRKITLLFAVLLVARIIYATNTTYTFHFDFNDFKLSSIGDSIEIASTKCVAVYPNFDKPGLPIVARSIGNIDFETVKDFTYTISKRLVCKDVDIRKSPIPLPTNVSVENAVTQGGQYPKRIYPDSNCTIQKSYNIGGVEIINFLISPFVYDAAARELYFVDSLVVDMDMESIDFSTVNLDRPIRQNQIDMISALIENKDILENIPVTYADESNAEIIDYIIITANEFVDAYQPLADWKHKKGVRSKIVTVEDIYNQYEGATKQMQIKNCIKDYYDNHYTMYVLLGGDTDVVPAQYCFVKTDAMSQNDDFQWVNIEADIPSDIYYACLGELNWDTNGDGKAGALDFYNLIKRDNISYVPQLAVSRLPLRTIDEINSYITRIVNYEQNPNYRYSILQAGADLEGDKLRGEVIANLVYDSTISGKVRIESIKLFNTIMLKDCNNVDSVVVSNPKFTTANFITELNNGYHYIELISHGEKSNLSDGHLIFFTNENAETINNSGYSLITTTACLTNAFDTNETRWDISPCLSEVLIRNPKSGIIGYLGASRFGWYYKYPYCLELSFAYEKDFYSRLLQPSQQPYIKNFGVLVNYVKCSFLSLVENDVYYRWLHYALNPIGDPELPIYSSHASYNTLANANYNEQGILVVDAGINDAKVCVSAINRNPPFNIPYYYSIKNGRILEFDTGYGTYDIWITKQNVIPKHIRVVNTNDVVIVEPGIKTITPNPASSYVTIGYDISQINPGLQVVITDCLSGNEYKYEANPLERELTIDISSLRNGFYIVSLIENGNLCSTTKQLIINKNSN